MPFKNLFIILYFLIFSAIVLAQSPDSVLALDDLLPEMMDRNPSLHAQENAVLALQTKILQQGSLPDPMLSLAILNIPTDTYSLSKDPMSQKMISLSQTFPFFGKLSLKEQLAEKEYLRGQQNLAKKKWDLLEQLKQEYFELSFILNSLEISNENLQLLRDFVKITTTRYRVGKGIQQDILRSELESLRFEKMIIILEQKRESSQARINTLLNYPPDRQLGKPILYEIPLNSWKTAELESLAVRNNPALAEAHLSLEQKITSRDLAGKQYWPDFTLAFNYGQRENYPDMISGIVSFSIPLFAGRKQSKKVEEETVNVRAVEDRYQQIKNDMIMQIKLIQDNLTRDAKIINLYKKSILPQAELALESAIAAYQTDRVDFLTLLNSQTTLLDHRLDFYQTRRDYLQNLATLEKICATNLIDNKREK